MDIVGTLNGQINIKWTQLVFKRDTDSTFEKQGDYPNIFFAVYACIS